MTTKPRLEEGDVRRLASGRSFERGEDYYLSDSVLGPQRRGDTLVARVEGSRAVPYRVTVTLDAAGVREARCSCPYDWGGACKHVVAVLLAYVREPSSFTQRPEPAELLGGLDVDGLRVLLGHLIDAHPELLDEVESRLAADRARAASPEGPGHARITPLDPAPFRRRIATILEGIDADPPWAAAGTVEQLEKVLREARDFLEADDAASALTVLEVLGDGVVGSYPELEYVDSDVDVLIEDMARSMAEAILAADLPPELRKEQGETLSRWEAGLEDYGADDMLALAVAALESRDAEPGEDDEGFEAELADLKLNILERRGDAGGFLALARERGLHLRHALKLVDLGRFREAADRGLEDLERADDALVLAERLREGSDGSTEILELAAGVAEQGLELEGNRHHLGVWLANTAVGMGRDELAQRARVAAFEDMPSLEGYEAVRGLAGDHWTELRPRLMDAARGSLFKEPLVDILLHEGRIDEAVAVAEKDGDYRLLGRVADAAAEIRPDWVVRVGMDQAEGLIGRVQTKYYTAAVRWLEKVRAACLAADREKEWCSCLADLRRRHGRKRALMGMLDAMG